MPGPTFSPGAAPIPPKAGSPLQQPGTPQAQPINIVSGLPGQIVNKKWTPNLQKLIHPEAERAIRVLFQQVYDLQDAMAAQQSQLVGGAIATATVAAGVVTVITVQSGGYYQNTPLVSFSGGTPVTQATAHAVMDGHRVVSVVVDDGGDTYSSTPSVVFTVQ